MSLAELIITGAIKTNCSETLKNCKKDACQQLHHKRSNTNVFLTIYLLPLSLANIY